MTTGQAVDVRRPWAGGPQVLYAWFPGYAFVRREGGNIIVRATKGYAEGIEVRYNAADVKASACTHCGGTGHYETGVAWVDTWLKAGANVARCAECLCLP